MKFTQGSLACLALVAALTVARQAHAELDAIELPLEDLLKVRILSTPKFAEDPDKIPAAISILTAENIRTFGWRTIGDALRSLQGFNVTNDHTYAYAGTRGIAAPGDFRARMQVLIDGVSINENIYASTLIDSAFPLDIDLVERIEVIRGPSASVYGGDSMFGVINVVTRTGQNLSGTELGIDYGSGRQRQLRASWGGRLGNDHLMLSVSGFDAAGQSLSFNDLDISGAPQRIAANGAEQGGRLFVQARGADWRITLIHGQRERIVPHGSYGTIPGDTGHTEEDRFSALDISKDWQLGSYLKLQQRLYANAYGYDGRFPYDYSPTDPRVVNVDKARGNTWGIENRLISTAWSGHRWTLGLEYQGLTRLNQLNYDEGFGCYGVSSDACLDDRRHRYRLSLYAQDEMQVGNADTLLLGLRLDRETGFDSAWSPRFGYVHDAAAAGIFKLQINSAFRNPAAYELAYVTPTFLYGNPLLDSEKMRSVELSWEKRFDRSSRLSATLYRFSIDHMIMTDAAGIAANGQEVHATGLEVEYERQWSSGIALRTGFTTQNSHNEFGRMDNSPRHMAKFNLALPMLLPRLTTGIEGQWIGPRLANGGSETIHAYHVVNLNLSYAPPSKTWEAGLGIYNLFDHRYADPVAIDTALPLTRWAVPQFGRTYQLRARFSF